MDRAKIDATIAEQIEFMLADWEQSEEGTGTFSKRLVAFVRARISILEKGTE